MQVVAPDLLAEARELSVAVTAAGTALGFLLWLFGWRAHRFWIVLGATVAGGIAGLSTSPAYGVQPLVAGLLAAVAAGVLALALVRVVAFAAGAVGVCLAVHALAPAWEQPLVWALAGGLVGVFLFRLWTMALTSAAGTLLFGYSLLALLDRLGTLPAVAFAQQNAVLLNWLWGAVSLLGLLLQFLLERRCLRKQRQREEEDRLKAAEAEEDKRRSRFQAPPKRRWWGWGQPDSQRKAG